MDFKLGTYQFYFNTVVRKNHKSKGELRCRLTYGPDEYDALIKKKKLRNFLQKITFKNGPFSLNGATTSKKIPPRHLIQLWCHTKFHFF